MKKGNNKQPKVIFSEEGHDYWVEGKKAISATTLLGKFHDHMDTDYWQTYGAYKKILGEDGMREAKKAAGCNKFPFNMKPPNEFFDYCASITDPSDFFACKDEVKKEWKDSQINGTSFHKDREEELYESGVSVNSFDGKEYKVHKFEKQFDNQSLVDDLSKLEDGCYPELLVWREFDNFCVTGQIDVCYIEEVKGEGVRYVDLEDYKTNAKLGSKESYWKYHPPFDYLSDSKLIKYNLQLSLYQYILELWGYKPRHQGILHYKKYDPTTRKVYQFKYMREEVKKMLEIVNEEMVQENDVKN